MSSEALAIVMLAALIVMVLSGIRLAFAMMFLAVVFGFVFRGQTILALFMQSIFGVMQNEVLIAVPLFVLMGNLLTKSGAADKLFSTMYELFGPIRGGLAITTIIISTIFAAGTGIIAASVTTMALMALPTMIRRGYDHGLATGVVCAGGTLGILIPPSVMLVILGPMVGVSVASLFAGAIMPGLLLAFFYLVYVVVKCWLQPSAGPAIPLEERVSDKGQLLLKAFLYLLPILALLMAVLGSILLGIATPTEASAVGVLGAGLIAALYRSLSLEALKDAVLDTVQVSSMVFFVIIGAAMFTAVFLFMGGGRVISSFVMDMGLSRWAILALIMLLVFALGMVLDWIGILFIVIPIFTPIAAQLGFDPLYFTLLVAVNLQMSFLTPPFAYSIFFVKGVAPPEVKTTSIYRGVIPFVLLQAVVLFLCVAYPQLLLWLPNRT
ncbi:MAG: TRAP transporter large permease subunit [Deinococcota bacterium]|nr:TRAP transporter large permease subunit [Deinococcota bacterium]